MYIHMRIQPHIQIELQLQLHIAKGLVLSLGLQGTKRQGKMVVTFLTLDVAMEHQTVQMLAPAAVSTHGQSELPAQHVSLPDLQKHQELVDLLSPSFLPQASMEQMLPLPRNLKCMLNASTAEAFVSSVSTAEQTSHSYFQGSF